MPWAVIYIRHDRNEPRRRAECLAEAQQQGLGVHTITSDPQEARRLKAAGCQLITPPEQHGDVDPDVILARRAHRLRRQLPAVAPLLLAGEWLRRQLAPAPVLALVGLLLVGGADARPRVAPEPRPPVAVEPPQVPSPRPSPPGVSPPAGVPGMVPAAGPDAPDVTAAPRVVPSPSPELVEEPQVVEEPLVGATVPVPTPTPSPSPACVEVNLLGVEADLCVPG